MGIKMRQYARASLAPLLSLTMLFSVGATVSGQTTQPMQPSTPTFNPTDPSPVGPTPRPPAQGDDITRRDIVDMNRFLDSHPEIAEQLRKDPSLIDNRQWVANHPALQEYLKSHSTVAEAFRTNPNQFMRDEDRDNRITRPDIVDMDRFLDSHPEIAEQLRKDPSLIDNGRWVADHPALQEYLKSHATVAGAFRTNPNQFMRDEDRYDRQDGDHNQLSAANRDERNRGELTSFGQFLSGHSSVAEELSSDPSLANNKEYLASHPELDQYLKAHPTMSQQLAENPQEVMSSNSVQQGGGFSAKPVGPTPKPKTNSSPNQ